MAERPDDPMRVYIDVANEHLEAINDARWNVTHDNADNISAALVAIDEAMRSTREGPWG